jgi:2-succinyl-5-enolpyruvyl-6-hydroxy-3-cyclohexene-1-carboxylate synthase
MGPGDANLARASALVDALVAGGVRHACLSPGSRSTPIALALDRDRRISLHIHLDERSSAFFALGISKATSAPAIVACTSGTAAAELFPGVVEASQSRVPLILLTADRPPRLRGTGANQAIDQTELYGRYARRFLEAPLGGEPDQWGMTGRDAIAAAAAEPHGPVQLNLPFDEPLIPGTPTPPNADRHAAPEGDASSGGPTSTSPVTEVAVADVERARRELDVERGVVVVGSMPAAPGHVLDLAEHLGWPVLAEPTSRLRLPGRALSAGQLLVGSVRWTSSHRPEVVLQIGSTPTTRTTQRFVSSAERLLVVDRAHLDPDPEGRAAWRLEADPDALAASLLDVVAERSSQGFPGWTAEWQHADAAARAALDATPEASDEPFEGRVARDVAATMPDGGTLFVGNSMPVRDLDAFMAPREGLRVLANRGASGIDGLVSTALGMATAGDGPTVALLGDLSLLHDAGALVWNGRRHLDLVLVVPNNGGGGVFDFTGQAALPEHERLFITPHGADLRTLADAARVDYARIERAADLVRALEDAVAARGIHLLEVPIERTANVRRHAEVQTAVDAALA